jgi:hypothetical protein
MVRVLLPLIAVGLAVYALADCATSTEQDRSGIPKGLWIVMIIFLPFVGPLAWILVKRSQHARQATTATGYPATSSTPAPRPTRRRSGPVAPDDDPDFLWTLEQQRRRDARSTGDSTADDADDATTDDVTGQVPPAGPTQDAVEDSPVDDGSTDERDRNEGNGQVSDEELPDDPFTEPPGGAVGGSGSSR